jgi:hypothetical protein
MREEFVDAPVSAIEAVLDSDIQINEAAHNANKGAEVPRKKERCDSRLETVKPDWRDNERERIMMDSHFLL